MSTALLPARGFSLSRAWILLALVALLAPPAHSQPEADQEVHVRAVADRPRVSPGETFRVAVVMDHGHELHTWPAAHVDLPKSIVEDFGPIYTSIEPTGLPDGLRLLGIQWPEPKLGHVPSPTGEGTIESPLYQGVATAFLVLQADQSLAPGDLAIPVRVRFQACNEEVCFQPQTLTINVSVQVSGQPSEARNESALFSGFKEGEVRPTAVAPPSAVPGGPVSPSAGSQPPPAPAMPVVRNFLGFEIGGSLLVLFLIAILGGAVLNLTPCVLPIIPIKIMTLVEHAESANRRLVLGLWMALGVVAFWVAVGVPMMFVSSLDPSRLIFGNWWVTFGLGLVITLMGMGIMGLFNLNLPQSVYLINPKANNPQGSFLFGVMTGVLGLPCFGFVAGGLLAGAATLPPVAIFAIFLGLGIGMAAPYLVLSVNPSLVKRLPRTGPASDLVKQVLGFLLLAAAAFFFASSVKTFLSHYPWYADSMQYWAAALFVLIAAVWLIVRIWQISRAPAARIGLSLIAALFAWGAVAFAHTTSKADREDYEARVAAGAGDKGEVLPGVWNDFEQTLVDKARAEDKVVFVEYTAPWCITCKFQKRAVLDSETVRSRLDSTTLFKANIDEPEASDSLSRLGRTGIPTYAIYGPGLTEPIILNSATPQMVIDALNQAGAKPLTHKGP